MLPYQGLARLCFRVTNSVSAGCQGCGALPALVLMYFVTVLSALGRGMFRAELKRKDYELPFPGASFDD